MFPVVCSKTAMPKAVFIALFIYFYLVHRNTVKRNLFINKTERNTQKNNNIDMGPIGFFFVFISQISQRMNQIYLMFGSKKSFYILFFLVLV